MFLKLKLKYLSKKNHIPLGILDKAIPFYKPFLFLIPSLLAIILFTLIPFILTIYESFRESSSAFIISEQSFGPANYQKIFELPSFTIGVRNTVIYSILALPISLTFSILISSAVVSVSKKIVKETWLSIFFMPYITSTVAIATTFFYMFDTTNGLMNVIIGKKIPWLTDLSQNSWTGFGAILINGVWSNLAFQILILTTAMMAVDKNLYKSASIDGSSKANQFFKITLPSIKKSLSFLITIGIIGSIKVFPLALYNNDALKAISTGGSTLMLLVFYYTTQGDFATAGAAAIILFAIGLATSFALAILLRLVIKVSVMIGDNRVKAKINNYKLLR